MAPRERARILRRFADLVAADVETLAPLEAIGSTRPVRDAAAWDVPFTAEGIRFYAEFADKLGGEVMATDHDHLGMTIAEPYGVIGAIAPWNFPLVMASWKIAPALAAGNAVVLKPSEMTPFSVLRLAELAVAGGRAEGHLQRRAGRRPHDRRRARAPSAESARSRSPARRARAPRSWPRAPRPAPSR